MNKPAAFIIVEGRQTWLKTSAETEEAIRTGFIMETIPLYTASPKREPLSDDEINAYLSLIEPPFLWDEGFCSGIEWAEKQHGIGGGE